MTMRIAFLIYPENLEFFLSQTFEDFRGECPENEVFINEFDKLQLLITR